MLAIKDGHADTRRIEKDVTQLNSRINTLEELVNERLEREKRDHERRRDMQTRTIERVVWGLILGLVAFGKSIWERLVGE